MSETHADIEPGTDRFWHGVPNKSATKPLMIELRHKWSTTRDATPRYSRLIGYGTCEATDEAVAKEKRRILEVAGRLDEFTGIHE